MQRLTDAIKPLVSSGVRRRVVTARLRGRLLTSRFRVLPDFLIVGAMRAGTSSLYKYLGYHPSVAPSLRKEIHYFTTDYWKGERWYRAHFPTRFRKRYSRLIHTSELLTFEATPDYLFHPRAPERAAELIPQAKVIALLRNPVDRAIAHFKHNVRGGYEELPFDDAVASEPERLVGELERLREDPLYDCYPYRRYSYVARGIYVDQLEHWSRFYPRECILVVKSEDLFEQSAETFRRILEFLELSPWQPRWFPNYSYTDGKAGSDPSISEEAREHLAAEFATHNARLYAFLGRDLGW